MNNQTKPRTKAQNIPQFRARGASTRSTGSKAISITRSPGTLLPDKLDVTFRFQSAVSFVTDANQRATYEFSMNSPFDPLYTVGGGNCTGFATLMLLYSRFFVKRARILLAPVQFNTPGDTFFVMPVRSDEAAAGVLVDIDMVTESQVTNFTTAPNAPAAYRVLEDVRRPDVFQGLSIGPGKTSNKDDLSGSPAVDPVIQPAWYVGLIGAQGHTMTGSVLIEYSSELYRPNTLSNA